MTSELSNYIERLGDCFYLNDEIDVEDYFKEYKDKPGLVAGLSEMEIYRPNWDRFVKTLKEINFFNVRDTSLICQTNSFKALVTFPENIGIVLAVSFPFKLFGVYYSKLEKEDSSGRFRQRFSYFPFDEKSKVRKDNICDILKQEFRDIVEFNNEYAAFKLDRICIEGSMFENLDLWCALFVTYQHGII